MPATRKRNVNRKQKKGKGKGRGKTMKVMIVAAVPCHPSMIKKIRGGKGLMRGGAWYDNLKMPSLFGQSSTTPVDTSQPNDSKCPPGSKPGILYGCRTDTTTQQNTTTQPSTP